MAFWVIEEIIFESLEPHTSISHTTKGFN